MLGLNPTKFSKSFFFIPVLDAPFTEDLAFFTFSMVQICHSLNLTTKSSLCIGDSFGFRADNLHSVTISSQRPEAACCVALAPDPPFPLPILLLLLFVTFVVNHHSKIYKNENHTTQINSNFLNVIHKLHKICTKFNMSAFCSLIH